MKAGNRPSSAQAPIPPLLPDAPPLAILVDYDGTIARTDVSDRIIRYHLAGDWSEADAQWLRGEVGSRSLFERQAPLLVGDEAELMATAASQPHHPTFAPFVERARSAGIPVEVVSDSFGFFIEPALRSLGIEGVPIISARTTFGPGGPRMSFPYGHPECFVCGTCKRNRVLAHQDAGRAVVFVGDGGSDRYAAAHADVVFATRLLIDVCRARGWPFREWHDFGQIQAWLDETIEAWARDPRTLPGPARRPFICGPEVWGPGRSNPAPSRDAWMLADEGSGRAEPAGDRPAESARRPTGT